MDNLLTDDENKLLKDSRLLLIFNPPAMLNEINNLELLIDSVIPPFFKNFYLSYNGQNKLSKSFENNMRILSISEITNEWQIWAELVNDGIFDDYSANADKEIKDNWWNRKWIPFTSDFLGNHLCLDLDPSGYGTYGQIIQVWHDDNERKFISCDFSSWLMEQIN